MTYHYPDLGIASDWLKQIFNQSKVRRGTSGVVAKCRLFCQAMVNRAGVITWQLFHLLVCHADTLNTKE